MDLLTVVEAAVSNRFNGDEETDGFSIPFSINSENLRELSEKLDLIEKAHTLMRWKKKPFFDNCLNMKTKAKERHIKFSVYAVKD